MKLQEGPESKKKGDEAGMRIRINDRLLPSTLA